jgi:GNAT superfamily N-acetyltransferase
VTPYTKTYGFDEAEFARHAQESDLFAIVADFAGRDEPIGYALAAVDWSGFAVVDGIAVDRAHRGAGVARALMDASALGVRAPACRDQAGNPVQQPCRMPILRKLRIRVGRL